MSFTNLMAAGLLLGLLLLQPGCGCTDDTLQNFPPNSQPALFGVHSFAPPIPLRVESTQPVRIDIAFVLDDSFAMNLAWLGLIPYQPDDRRERSQAAQEIMRNVEKNLRAALTADYIASGVAPEDIPAIDLAFAVARYEDFGGPFTDPRSGPISGPIEGPTNDTDARPFILNMPILRQAHPDFEVRFSEAMIRTAPGNGNPVRSVPLVDAQTGLEALYQVAAPANGDGTFGGFDADGLNGTRGSGQPTSLDPVLNPQTMPGPTGDVPAVGFQLQQALDPDGEPQYAVTDEDGNVVMVPSTIGPGLVPSLSSGNLGGAGWRKDSARFVLLASDIATVTPTDEEPTGDTEFGAVLPPPGDDEVVTSKPGDATPTAAPRDAPRDPRAVLLLAFDGGFQFTPFVQRRTGIANGPVHLGGNGVAPVGAHTVQGTIDALNELDIEVLSIGAPFPGGADTKPGVTGVNGDVDSDIDEFDVTDPNVVRPDLAPWRWFTATSSLSMPQVTSVAKLGGVATFPAVYNFGTIWPFDANDPEGTDPDNIANNIRQTIVDDLVERIRDWVDTPYLFPPTLPGSGKLDPADLPTVTYKFTLDLLGLDGTEDVIQVSPTQAGQPQTHFELVLPIPVYYEDEMPPGGVLIEFPIFTFVARDDTVPLPATLEIPVLITAQLDSIGNQTAENAHIVQEIDAFIVARGNGTDFAVDLCPIPLNSPVQSISQGEGSVTVTVRGSMDNGQTAALTDYQVGYFIINDLAPGRDSSDQVGGTGPAFPPPPPDACW